MVSTSELKVILSGENRDLKDKLRESGDEVSAFGGIADKALGIAGAAATAFAAASGALIGTGVKIASDLQQAEASFTTLLQSGDRARAFLEELKQFSLATPFDLPSLTAASQRLIVMGMASEDVIPLLQSVGDAVAAVGGGAAQVETVSAALAKIQQTGQVTTRELTAITSAGIPAFELLATKLGVDVPAAMELAQDGAVDAATFVAAFMEGTATRFAGAMDRQQATFKGMLSSVKDEVILQLGNIAQPVLASLQPLIPTIGGALTTLIGTIGPSMGQFVTLVAGAVSRLLPLLAPVVEAIAAIAPLLIELVAVALPPFELLLAAILPIVGVLIQGLQPVLVALIPVVAEVAGIITTLAPLIEAVLQVVVAVLPVLGLLANALKILTPILEALNPLIQLLATVLTPIVRIVALIIEALVQLALALTGNREAWENFATALRAIGETLINGIKRLWDGLVEWFKNLGGRIIDGLVEGFRTAWERTKGFFADVGNGLKNAFKESLGIASPSRVFMAYGHNIVEGLELGLRGIEGVMQRAGLGDVNIRAPAIAAPAGPGSRLVQVAIGRIEVPVTQGGADFDPARVGEAVAHELQRTIQEALE
jgi:tape measure domain-containing protein